MNMKYLGFIPFSPKVINEWGGEKKCFVCFIHFCV